MQTGINTIFFIVIRKKHISIDVIRNSLDYDGRKTNTHDGKLLAIYIHMGGIKPYWYGRYNDHGHSRIF